jgi:16S rRNA (uracil1498-N3)-methyltransferase
MSAPVFLCPAVATAAVGDAVWLEGAEARHAITVQRRERGERIDLVDGDGRRASGVIDRIEGTSLSVTVEALTVDADPRVVLIQALAKGGRDEQAIESATELGVTDIVPWSAERSIVQWRGVKADKGRSKWESLALAATKQSRRAWVPRVRDVATTAQLQAAVRRAVAEGDRVLVLHELATCAVTQLVWESHSYAVWLIVGPEGGISGAELALLTDAGGEAVRLGPHVLRASTAGPAAIAALAAARGTWS